MASKFQPQYALLLRISSIASLFAGLAILFSLSYDILHNHLFLLTPAYLEVQFIACLVLLFDFAAHWIAANNHSRYFWRNLVFLLVSIPFLNIALWSGVELSREWYFILKMPLPRALPKASLTQKIPAAAFAPFFAIYSRSSGANTRSIKCSCSSRRTKRELSSMSMPTFIIRVCQRDGKS